MHDFADKTIRWSNSNWPRIDKDAQKYCKQKGHWDEKTKLMSSVLLGEPPSRCLMQLPRGRPPSR